MKQRLQKIDRIMKVQKHLHKSAELHLANLQQQERELKAAQEEMIQSMGDKDVLHGLFTDVLAKRLKVLASEEVQTKAKIVKQKAVTVERALQVKRTENVFVRLKQDASREREKKDLIATLEAMIQKSGTSLP